MKIETVGEYTIKSNGEKVWVDNKMGCVAVFKESCAEIPDPECKTEVWLYQSDHSTKSMPEHWTDFKEKVKEIFDIEFTTPAPRCAE